MEFERRPVTDEIRFAFIAQLPQVQKTETLISAIPDLPADVEHAIVGSTVEPANKLISSNNLWWIISVSVLVGAGLTVWIYEIKRKREREALANKSTSLLSPFSDIISRYLVDKSDQSASGVVSET